MECAACYARDYITSVRRHRTFQRCGLWLTVVVSLSVMLVINVQVVPRVLTGKTRQRTRAFLPAVVPTQ
jgi:hypothetical protein